MHTHHSLPLTFPQPSPRDHSISIPPRQLFSIESESIITNPDNRFCFCDSPSFKFCLLSVAMFSFHQILCLCACLCQAFFVCHINEIFYGPPNLVATWPEGFLPARKTPPIALWARGHPLHFNCQCPNAWCPVTGAWCPMSVPGVK